MIFDFTAAQKCSKKLKKYEEEMKLLCEDLKGICTELVNDDVEDIEEIGHELRSTITELEEQLEQLRSLICALDGIIFVWKNTEQRIIADAPDGTQRPSVLPVSWESMYTMISDYIQNFRNLFE